MVFDFIKFKVWHSIVLMMQYTIVVKVYVITFIMFYTTLASARGQNGEHSGFYSIKISQAVTKLWLKTLA